MINLKKNQKQINFQAPSLYPLNLKWSEGYKKAHPDITFNIQPVGAGKGLTNALPGSAVEPANAVVDKDGGTLSWQLSLALNETRPFRFSYTVKYPKDKTITSDHSSYLQAHFFDITSIFLRYNFDITSIYWIEVISKKYRIYFVKISLPGAECDLASCA